MIAFLVLFHTVIHLQIDFTKFLSESKILESKDGTAQCGNLKFFSPKIISEKLCTSTHYFTVNLFHENSKFHTEEGILLQK